MDKEKVTKTIGGLIKKRRTVLGISQEDLALKSGLHRTYIGSVERGERNVSIVNLKKIANTLGLTVSELTKDTL